MVSYDDFSDKDNARKFLWIEENNFMAGWDSFPYPRGFRMVSETVVFVNKMMIAKLREISFQFSYYTNTRRTT